VILFPDCFTVYSEPEIGRAAIHVLEHAGYRVIIPKIGCCGRAMISNGLLDDAIITCSRTATALAKLIEEHEPRAIVGCEPSCISALTDDWQDLKLDVSADAVRTIGNRAVLIEDFLAAEWDRHPRQLQVCEGTSTPVLLHGHCHQKALWGAERSIELLRRCGFNGATLLDTGCCGMAGAFGFAREHFDLSMRIGELSLFPQLRDQPEALVLAPGTSCRHQIRDALARHSMHPIQLIASALSGMVDTETS
jgi:Fe-S oxidoreductase